MKVQITQCDRCGKRDNGVQVDAWTARKGTQKYTGDLCGTCWTELLKIFKPSTLAKGRHQVVATELNDIPKNA